MPVLFFKTSNRFKSDFSLLLDITSQPYNHNKQHHYLPRYLFNMDDVMFPEDDHSVYYMILFLFVGHVMAPDFYDTYFNMGAGGTVSIAMQSGVALYQHITHWLTWHTIHRPIEWRWNSASTRHLGFTWREEIQWAHNLACFMTKVVSEADLSSAG